MTVKRILLGSVLSFVLAACATAGEPSSETIELFDGASLAGWRVSAENPDSFRVEDGVIVAHGPRAHLFYDAAAFENFELSLQVKTMPGSNSGVFFHTAYQAEGWPAAGYEAQVNATQSDTRKTGSIYAVADIRVFPDGERPVLGNERAPFAVLAAPPHSDNAWFDYAIRVEDGVVTTRVNGKLLVEWELPDAATADRPQGDGRIALQAHDPDSIVHYRNLELTRLP